MKEIPEERQASAQDLLLRAKEFWALFPAFISRIEFPDENFTKSRHELKRRRAGSELKREIMERFSSLLEHAKITPSFKNDILDHLSTEWDIGVKKPGFRVETFSDLPLEELNRRGFNFSQEEYDDLLANDKLSESASDYFEDSVVTVLGLDDPANEGIFNPEKAKKADRDAYHHRAEMMVELQKHLGELQFQQLNLWINRYFDSRGDTRDVWREEFVQLHNEQL